MGRVADMGRVIAWGAFGRFIAALCRTQAAACMTEMNG